MWNLIIIIEVTEDMYMVTFGVYQHAEKWVCFEGVTSPKSHLIKRHSFDNFDNFDNLVI